ncbi:HIRA-interacting protein 3 isoform X2 [Sander lucioperca]|uniref:HIRA-interacting protein 3 isoform X2 n=1 Tax=Sander lucioperca TaxID=283035 RepID=UPI00125E7258|nr:HIRA-interacting protein 3 isoform X2 [Sander lucioperca]
MVSEKERAGIRRFVCGQLRDEPDLSTLTLGILKRRYLAHVGCESLNPEARNVMKQVVKEELVKMQEKDENGSELETAKPQNKRKRDKENDEVISGKEEDDDVDESRAKKSRRQSTSSSESEDKEECETGSEEEAQMKSESEDAEQEVKNSKRIKNGNRKPQINSEDSSDEDVNKSEKKGNESDCDNSPKEMVIKRANATKTGETRSSNTSQGKTAQSDEENETDTDSKSEKSEKSNDSSDDSEKEEEVSVEKRDNDPESDSSSLPSIEDEKNSGKENSQDDKKKKTMKKEQKKEKSNGGQKGDKAVVRLKRYISLCGLRPNYKKLLDGCRSVRSQVAVLKKELEELGVHGQPSVKKCKIVRLKREETQELAELDVSNIIATKGRPKRRAASAWQEKCEPPSSTYLHTLNSGSDSNEENNSHRGRKRTDWANLQGIISDDADSN